MRRLSVLVGLLSFLALAAPAFAQDDRERTEVIADHTIFNANASSVSFWTSNGFRLIDLEYVGTSSGQPLFDASFVQNIGNYQSGYWWYYGLTAATLSSTLSSNQARLVDLEPYQTSQGLRFACIMVPNTGSNGTAWWWYYGASISQLSAQINANNARIVDLQPYTYNGQTSYAAVMIHNTGANYRPWWWYVNVTPAQLNIYLASNNARIYDLEPRSNGNFDVVMTRQTPMPYWYYWYGLTQTQVTNNIETYGARPVDIEGYTVNGVRRYAVVAVNNSNALETEVGNAMRARTDGTIGFTLYEVGNPLWLRFAAINSSREFEPASTMKTLHHVHAMREVHLGGATLNTPLTVFQNYSPPGSSCPVDVNPTTEPLGNVLYEMMVNSDNARTQAVTAHFGQSQINATAAVLGMTSTSLNHRLGCPIAASNPNWTTLRDLTRLHDEVAKGFLGSQRSTFYSTMQNQLSDLGLDTIMQTEGSSLGLPQHTINQFRSQCLLAHKGGSYNLQVSPLAPFIYHRAEFAYLELPWVISGVHTSREFAFGAFVNAGSSASDANAAIWQEGLPRLLRGLIRSAMQSWVGSSAGTTTIGSGCGSPTYTHSVSAPPQIGETVHYRGYNGLPNAIAVLAFGFSNTSANGVPLPVALQSLGYEPGCMAYNDWAVPLGFTSNGAGYTSYPLAIPFNTNLVGYEFYSQWFTLDFVNPSRSSNGLHTHVGL